MDTKNTDVLKKLLADTFSLYLKTLNYHWNVRKTKDFYEIHKLLEMQYEELAEALDSIAEAISIAGEYAPATYSEYQNLTSISEGNSKKSASDMLRELGEDNLKINKFIEENQDKVDFLTNDLLVGRARAHAKAAWMLNASKE